MNDTCEYCGEPRQRVIIRFGLPGGRGLHPLRADYGWDHQAPLDCIKTINRKLDKVMVALCGPENGQEG